MNRRPMIYRPPGYGPPGQVLQQPPADQAPAYCGTCGRPFAEAEPADEPKLAETPKPGGSKIVPIVLIIAIILALVFGVPFVMRQRPAADRAPAQVAP